MKNIFKIILVLSLVLSFTSCNDFLEENPKSSLTGKGYNQTQGQILEQVNLLYRTGAPVSHVKANFAYVGPIVSVSGMLTGYFSNSYEGQETYCKDARLLTRQENTMNVSSAFEGVWNDCYRAINIANFVIKYAPLIQMSENDRDYFLAQAKFFRAFNYFTLVKLFGDLPLSTSPYESADNLQIARTPASDIYKVIEDDLIFATENLPALTFYSKENGCRITKYASAMLLTSVYMQENKYDDAAKTAKIVIDSKHSLEQNDDLAMNSAFNKLRSIDGLNEVIYAYELNSHVSTGHWWPSYAFNSSAASDKVTDTYSITERVYGPTKQFLNVYNENDLRIQPNQFFHWDYVNPINGKEWHSKDAGCWFWYEEEAFLKTGKTLKDRNIFRYAEALLDGAEAIAQTQGVTTEAAMCLAEVQARSNKEGKTAEELATALTSLSKEDFIEACWTERLREFPLEFKLWDDCVRTMKFPVISSDIKGEVKYVDLIGAQNAAGATFKESDLLWPISLGEIQRNPNLTQNLGYQTK